MRLVIEVLNERDMKRVNNSSAFLMPTLVSLSVRRILISMNSIDLTAIFRFVPVVNT